LPGATATAARHRDPRRCPSLRLREAPPKRRNEMGMIRNLIHKVRHWFRSAATGRFVSADYADHHRDTTVREDNVEKLVDRFKRDA
jgi:uncharacterized protein (DUF3084 family)